jgi:hypothetical protein
MLRDGYYNLTAKSRIKRSTYTYIDIVDQFDGPFESIIENNLNRLYHFFETQTKNASYIGAMLNRNGNNNIGSDQAYDEKVILDDKYKIFKPFLQTI